MTVQVLIIHRIVRIITVRMGTTGIMVRTMIRMMVTQIAEVYGISSLTNQIKRSECRKD